MNSDSIRGLNHGFSDRLKKRAFKKGLNDAVDLAIALSENVALRALIQPRSSANNSKDKNDGQQEVAYKSGKKPSSLGATQYNTILRHVQDHWKTSDPLKIPNKYIVAYSLLLDCSTDYLYGLTQIETANMQDKEICDKTGITEEALHNLRSIALSYFDKKYGINASVKGSKAYLVSNMLSSPCFAELIDSLHAIHYYISRDISLNAEKEETLLRNQVTASSASSEPSCSENEYDEAAENEFFMLQETIDGNCLRIRTARYEAQEIFMLLLDDIFPTLKDFSIKI